MQKCTVPKSDVRIRSAADVNRDRKGAVRRGYGGEEQSTKKPRVITPEALCSNWTQPAKLRTIVALFAIQSKQNHSAEVANGGPGTRTPVADGPLDNFAGCVQYPLTKPSKRETCATSGYELKSFCSL